MICAGTAAEGRGRANRLLRARSAHSGGAGYSCRLPQKNSVCLFVCVFVCLCVCPPLASEVTFSLLRRSGRAFFFLNRCNVACGAVERDFRFRPLKNLKNSFSEVCSKLRSFSPPSDLPSRATLGAVSTPFYAVYQLLVSRSSVFGSHFWPNGEGRGRSPPIPIQRNKRLEALERQTAGRTLLSHK